MATVLDHMKQIINSIDDGGCSNPCPKIATCPPNYYPLQNRMPFAQVLISRPPPCLAPTKPAPVKPLRLPCHNMSKSRRLTEEEALRWRYSNFYNNYNIDWHPTSPVCPPPRQSPCGPCGPCSNCPQPPCTDYCPTGFKTCTMRLMPPSACDPFGVWCAEIQKCPPKPRKKVSYYMTPGPCTRPCCLHWQPRDGPCLYDKPCRAHCFNHITGIKPRHRAPAC